MKQDIVTVCVAVCLIHFCLAYQSSGAAQCLGELYRHFGRKITSGLLETTSIAMKLIRFNEVVTFILLIWCSRSKIIVRLRKWKWAKKSDFLLKHWNYVQLSSSHSPLNFKLNYFHGTWYLWKSFMECVNFILYNLGSFFYMVLIFFHMFYVLK